MLRQLSCRLLRQAPAAKGLGHGPPPPAALGVARGGSALSRPITAAAAEGGGGTSTEAPKAALLVIGDEILSGSITDANTPWLAKLLHSRGVDLVRVEYVPDDEDDIAATALRLRERVGSSGSVFTSGGIGPTHDDKTYEALATAFDAELQLHEPTKALMEEHYERRGVELNAARLRMATLPHAEGVEVLFSPGLWVPLVNLHGVYILPGIPKLFQRMVEAHMDRWRGAAALEQALYSNLGEGDLAVALGNVAAMHPRVRVGSYPNVEWSPNRDNHVAFRVKLQFESRDPEALEAAVAAARQHIPTFDL